MSEPDLDTPRNPQESPPPRRRFLMRLTLGLSGLVAALAAAPPLAFLLWPLRREVPRAWRTVGRVEDFEEGTTVKVTYEDPDPVEWAGTTGVSAAWLRHEPGGHFVAFSVYCTHTACPVKWVQGARLFLCPCHGGAFHADGSVAAGPPPSPLPRHEVRVRDGQVQLRTLPVRRVV